MPRSSAESLDDEVPDVRWVGQVWLAGEVMLALCTPTRKRWQFLAKQAAAIAPQLNEDDRWIIVIDNDTPDERYTERIREVIGDRLLIWAHLCYERPEPPVGIVNRLRNAAVAFAAPEADIVEVDDHDILRPDCLSEIRHAFEAGNDYVFGWHKTDLILDHPNGERVLETWPDERPVYERGDFTSGKCQPSGVRAFRRELWNKLGGWDPNVWPEGNWEMADRAEALGARICCVQKPLCVVLIDPLDGISTKYRRKWEASQAPQAAV